MRAFVFEPSNRFIGKFQVADANEVPEALATFLATKKGVPRFSYCESCGRAWTIVEVDPVDIRAGRFSFGANGALESATLKEPHSLPSGLSEVEIEYLSYKGRLGRLPFLLYGLLLNIGATVAFFGTLFVLAPMTGKAPDFRGGEFGMLSVGFWVVGIPYLYLGLPVIVKRLHDFGQPGGLAVVYLLVSLIPMLNVLAGLTMLLIPGTTGPNKYGPKTGFAFSKPQIDAQ